MGKKKITVIGGGLGAMTAVCQLMRQPNAVDLYEIDIYQMGWRLGGKGASGVNPEKGHRVEEHGIHFWFGFYDCVLIEVVSHDLSLSCSVRTL